MPWIRTVAWDQLHLQRKRSPSPRGHAEMEQGTVPVLPCPGLRSWVVAAPGDSRVPGWMAFAFTIGPWWDCISPLRSAEPASPVSSFCFPSFSFAVSANLSALLLFPEQRKVLVMTIVRLCFGVNLHWCWKMPNLIQLIHTDAKITVTFIESKTCTQTAQAVNTYSFISHSQQHGLVSTDAVCRQQINQHPGLQEVRWLCAAGQSLRG